MIDVLSFKLIQSSQPNISLFKKILMIFDFIQQKSTKISFISPQKLMTHNRKDIEYRIQFLKDVIDNSILPEKTLYYQFIADDDKNIIMDAKKVSDDFLKLYENSKNKSQTLKYWADNNIVKFNGQKLPNINLKAYLILPDGNMGKAFLVYDNFFKIKKYNASTYYALSIGILADRIKY